MANTLNIYPLGLSPASLGRDYKGSPLIAVGGTAPYTFAVSGSLPIGLALNQVTGQAVIAGRPMVADQFVLGNSGTMGAQTPVVQNISTFTVSVTDSLAATGSVVYTMPVYTFSELEVISIYEMLAAIYTPTPSNSTFSSFYITIDNLGIRAMKMGDIGSPAYGGLSLVINAYLNSFSTGMIERMRYYICRWDQIKLITIKQYAGGVADITGLSMNWQDKRQQLIGLVKALLPAYTLAEINARENHGGGSDSTGSVTGGGSTGMVQLTGR